MVLTNASALLAKGRPVLEDAEISKAVERSLLFDPVVSPHLIDVKTNQGVVTLSGSVNNLISKERAVKIAETIKGVRAVVNMLEVKTIERSDRDLRDDIKKALMNDSTTETYDIDVKVTNGVATLSGTVDAWVEKKLAAKVAEGVKGLRDLKNDITVKPFEKRTDDEIKHDIRGLLRADVYVNDVLINVNVKDGNVKLSGEVGSLAEKTRAADDSWVRGVLSVDNKDLDVEWWDLNEARRKTEFVIKSDDEIKKAVRDTLLYDPRVYSFEPHIDVNNGEVTLTGVVDNLMAKRAAKQDAKNTIGVWKVRNFLKVRPPKSPTDSEIKQNILKAFNRDYTLYLYDLTVDVLNQKVFLYGTVDTHFEKSHAEKVASGIHGVIEVENYISIRKPWKWKSDAEIAEDVRDRLFWDPNLDKDEIEVTVEDGIVNLKGKAMDWFNADSAVHDAFEGGARSVRANLKLANGSTYKVFYVTESDFYWPDYSFEYPY